MTATGSVSRWALLRSGTRHATVTRVTPDAPDAPPAYIVEAPHLDALGVPTFKIAPTWREAMRLAADALTLTIARGGNVRAWE
jgi:hypothetical protein